MEPVAGIDVTFARDGHLELSVPSAGILLVYTPVATAMWVALCATRWNIDAAARMLAEIWESDAAPIRTNLQDWIVDLFGEGVLSI